MNALVQTIDLAHGFEPDLGGWLAGRAREYSLCYLLAHADDGVIWGRLDGDELSTSHSVAPEISPKLRPETLQQCRLFGPAGELLVWRDGNGWRARLAADGNCPAEDCFDEDQILWGTTVEDKRGSFTLLRDGAQGLRHAVPIPVNEHQVGRHEVRLRVRHYLSYDDDGQARVALSRLVTLLPEESERRPE